MSPRSPAALQSQRVGPFQGHVAGTWWGLGPVATPTLPQLQASQGSPSPPSKRGSSSTQPPSTASSQPPRCLRTPPKGHPHHPTQPSDGSPSRAAVRRDDVLSKPLDPGAGQLRFKSCTSLWRPLVAADHKGAAGHWGAPPGTEGSWALGVLGKGSPPLPSAGILPVNGRSTHFAGEKNKAQNGA